MFTFCVTAPLKPLSLDRLTWPCSVRWIIGDLSAVFSLSIQADHSLALVCDQLPDTGLV